MDVCIDSEEEEHLNRLEERWKYGADDVPPIGLEGTEEHDRELVDDYDTRYIRYQKYISVSSLTRHFSFPISDSEGQISAILVSLPLVSA